MWRVNYTYRPEYAVYAKGDRHGMVDYMAKVHILSRLCDSNEEIEHDVWEKVSPSIRQSKLQHIMRLIC
jgi:hypothetical protein